MNFPEKVFEATADLRIRALSLANAALTQARARADVAAKRVANLKAPLATLSTAGKELNKVARQHAVRFVKQNSTLALAAGKDVSALARTTYATLATRAAKAPVKARAKTSSRKSPARKRSTMKTAKAA